MEDDEKLSVLEEAKSYLEMAINELKDYSKDFDYYIELVKSDIHEINSEIAKLEEKTNEVCKQEKQYQEREYWASQF